MHEYGLRCTRVRYTCSGVCERYQRWARANRGCWLGGSAALAQAANLGIFLPTQLPSFVVSASTALDIQGQ
jgi:hypothetical protein